MRTALVVAAVLAGLAVGLVALVWALQRSLVYLPGGADVPPASSVLPRAEEVVLRTSDGLELTAWYVPARSPALDVTALVAHGNAGDRADRAPLARRLAERGMPVLLLEYRGYGGNPGTPTQDGLALDVRAAHDYLTRERGVPPDRLLYLGESLGAAVVAELATERPPAGLVLRSPFRDLAAVARVHYPIVPGWLLRDELAVERHVEALDVPTVVVYGEHDSVVPPEQSVAVARGARNLHALVAVPGADHNDADLVAGDPLVDAVAELAESLRR